VGSYEDAGYTSFKPLAGKPGIEIDINGFGCTGSTRRFTVHDVGFGPTGVVQ
jgi:hypothetical protein